MCRIRVEIINKSGMKKIPSVSFCITCKNRLHQIRQTLEKNLDDNRLFAPLIEFILVDFGSKDGLKKWIKDNFKKDCESGYLKYYYTEELPDWHASVAKNTAHLLAGNDIVVNLDCDNYTGYNGGRFIIRRFIRYGENCVIQQYKENNIHDGTYGRISVMRSLFKKSGGYDEEFLPMSYQDTDLILRLIALGAKHINIADPAYSLAIRNTKEEGVKYANSRYSWREMFKINIDISNENLRKGKLIANNGSWGIRNGIFDMEGNSVIQRLALD
jgi:glycosyltransferase involved in cell wall biosynthesis